MPPGPTGSWVVPMLDTLLLRRSLLKVVTNSVSRNSSMVAATPVVVAASEIEIVKSTYTYDMLRNESSWLSCGHPSLVCYSSVTTLRSHICDCHILLSKHEMTV